MIAGLAIVAAITAAERVHAQLDCAPGAYSTQLGPYNGYAVGFDPAVQTAVSTNGPSLELPANWTEATIEVWQKVGGSFPYPNQSTFFITFDGAPNNPLNRVQAHVPWGDDTRVYWDFGDYPSGAGRLSVYNPSVDFTRWHHYAFVASQTGNADVPGPFMRIYRDGVLEAHKNGSDAVDTDPVVTYSPLLRLGGLAANPPSFFRGQVAEFRIWTVARTHTQIQADMLSNEPNGDGLLLHWRFTEGTGTQTADLSGNDHTGFTLSSNGTQNVPIPWHTIWADTGSFGTLDPCRVPQLSLPAGQPSTFDGCTGSSFQITVDAEPAADAVSAYQWMRNGVDIPGQTNRTLTIPATTAADSGAYSVRATNMFNLVHVDSLDVATLTVFDLPTIEFSATTLTVCANAPLHIGPATTGLDLTFSWQRNGSPVEVATGSSFTVPFASSGDAGAYQLIVEDSCGNQAASEPIDVMLSDHSACGEYVDLIRAGVATEIVRSNMGTDPKPRIIAVIAALREVAMKNPLASAAQMEQFATDFNAALLASSPGDPDLNNAANFLAATRFTAFDINGLNTDVGVGALQSIGIDTTQPNRELHFSGFFRGSHINFAVDSRVARMLSDSFLGYTSNGVGHPLLAQVVVAYLRSQDIEPYPTGAELAADYPEIVESMAFLPTFDEFLLDQTTGFTTVQSIVANRMADISEQIADRIDDTLVAIADNPTILDQLAASLDEATVNAAIEGHRQHLRRLGVSRSAISLSTLLARNGAAPDTTETIIRLQDLSSVTLQVNENLSTASTALQGAGGLLQGFVDLVAGDPKDQIKAIGQIASSVGQLLPLFDDMPSVDEQVFGQIIAMRQQLQDVQVQLNGRFDRIDQSLSTIYNTMVDGLNLINEQTQQIDGNVQELQVGLATVASNLNRLEQNLYGVLSAGFEQDLIIDMDTSLGVLEREGVNLPYTGADSFSSYSTTFFTWARTLSASNVYAGPNELTLMYDATAVDQLGNYPLGYNINNLRMFPPILDELALAAVRLSNPTTWALCAGAYTQIARENPWYFARTNLGDPSRLTQVIGSGTSLRTAMNNARNPDLFQALIEDYEIAVQALQQEIDIELDEFMNLPPVGPPIPQLNFWGGICADTQPWFDYSVQNRIDPWFTLSQESSLGDWWNLLPPANRLAVYLGIQQTSEWTFDASSSCPFSCDNARMTINSYRNGVMKYRRLALFHPCVMYPEGIDPGFWFGDPPSQTFVESQLQLMPPPCDPLMGGHCSNIPLVPAVDLIEAPAAQAEYLATYAQVEDRLQQLQQAYYTRVLTALDSTTAIGQAADKLDVIESLLDAYTSIALPQSLNYSNVIRSAFRGTELKLGKDAVREVYENALAAAQEELQLSPPDVVNILTTRMDALKGEFDVVLDQTLSHEVHPYIRLTLADLTHLQSTVNQLALDDIYSTAPGAPLVVPTASAVLSNDAPTPVLVVPVPPVQAIILTQPQHGVLTPNPDGLGGFTYTPNQGFAGTDSFTYRAQANIIPPPGAPNLVNSDPATVLIRVESFDYDHDGDVDLSDARRFLACLADYLAWFPDARCVPASFHISDFDHDGDVNLHDVAALQRYFTVD